MTLLKAVAGRNITESKLAMFSGSKLGQPNLHTIWVMLKFRKRFRWKQTE